MSATPKIVEEFDALLADKSDEDLQVLAYTSPAVHFALFMEIKDKNGHWIRPWPNVLQLRVSQIIEVVRERCPGLRIRIIGVKPRRVGLSTFSLFCGYHECQKRPIEGQTIADLGENSEMLTEKLVEYSQKDSYPWDNPLVRDGKAEKEWANGAKWTVDTAENPDAGVGGTRQFGHFSEVAKFPQTKVKNDKKTMSAALPAYDGDNTICIAESTPEMMAGWFYETFQEAVWLDELLAKWDEGFRPEEIWIRAFAAWHEFPDNARKHRVTDTEREYIDNTLDEEEAKGRRKYGWTYEQIAWRRDTIKSVCKGDKTIFNYYYPQDHKSCWVAGGSPRFNAQRLAEWKHKAASINPEEGDLVRQAGRNVVFQRCHDGTGSIQVWETPRPGCKYLCAIDPAESISQTVGEDTDPNSVLVWRAGYFDTVMDRWIKTKLVARLKPPFRGEEDEVAQHAIRLATYYGNCIIAPETNKGFHVLRVLQEAGMSIYKRRPISHRTGRVEEQFGYKTDQNNRDAIISGFASAIENDELEIHCPNFLDECRTFIRGEKRAEAAPGCHDDDVMAGCIAWDCMPSATLFNLDKAKHQDPRDDKSWRSAATKW